MYIKNYGVSSSMKGCINGEVCIELVLTYGKVKIDEAPETLMIVTTNVLIVLNKTCDAEENSLRYWDNKTILLLHSETVVIYSLQLYISFSLS